MSSVPPAHAGAAPRPGQTPPAAPQRQAGVSLRVKFLLLVSVGFIVSGLVFGGVFSLRFERTLRGEFRKRGETLVRGLAASSRLDVWAGNKERLTRVVESAREEADVIAAAVYNERREFLARAEKVPGAFAERPPLTPRSGVRVTSREEPGAGRMMAFLAPVVLSGTVEPDLYPDALGEGGARPRGPEIVGAVEIVFSLADVERRIREVTLTTVRLTGGVVGLGIVLVVLLSRIFVTPIEAIAATARNIAAGDRSLRADVGSRDEIGDLADAFNTMTATLADREEDLRRMNVGLEQKVRERTSELELKQEELVAANVELERASRLKSEFLANMSHELRTPLNAVNGFSELLLEETYGPLTPKQRRYVDNILSSGRHLLQLINDILDLSKIEAGRLELHWEEFSLRQAIENATAVIQPLAQKKGLAVEVAIESGLDRVVLDPGKTKQVLYNLMSNAVKFTDQGKIAISAAHAKDAPGWLDLVVADTGIGIRPEDQRRLFRAFEQVDGSHARRYEGTGLGLALTRKLLELQGGMVEVESEIGKGSRFVARLPIDGRAARV